MKKSELKELIKEEIKEEMNSFSIDPNLAFKIYDILKEVYPEIKRDSKSNFFYLINDGLKK